MKNLYHFLTLSLCAAMLSCAGSRQKVVETNNPLPEWAMGGFVRPEGVNPVIKPDTSSKFMDPMSDTIVGWEESDTFNPAAAVMDGKIYVLYRAEDNSAKGIGKRTSRIGLAESTDGTNMTRRPEPVLFPADDNAIEIEWPGGCEDPRVAMTEDGTYVMAYTAWNRKTPRLAIATSKDLVNWEKHGLAFDKAYDGRFGQIASKSASIVTRLDGDRQVITKVNGKYLMYWGEHGVYAATSDDLINWEPVVDGNGELLTLMSPREGYFDSALTECGPPAIMTDDGILLLYNGKNRNDDNGRDKRFNAGAYCAGQVLFDAADPYKVKERLDVPFFRPMADFEKSGQYVDGTVFIEGLVFYQGKWHLYYGCADSMVGVAIYDPATAADADEIPELPAQAL